MKTLSKIILLSIVYLAFVASVFAQQSTFTSVFYDLNGEAQGYGIVQSFDSNYMVVGSRDYSKGLILKMDTDGNIIWDKKIEFGNFYSMLTRIVRTADSCFVIIGNNYSDMLIMKINVNGDTLWTKTIDLGFEDYPVSIQQTFDKGFIIGGYSYTDVKPYIRMAVVKLDSLGNSEWAYHYAGGTSLNQLYSAKQTIDSGYIITGYFSDNSYTDDEAFLAKLTPGGTISWSKKLEIESTTNTSGFDTYIAGDGLIVYADISGGKTALIKTDFSGNVLWSKNYWASTEHKDILGTPMPTIQPTYDGGFAFATVGMYNGKILKVDSVGNLEWVQYEFLISVDVIETFEHGFLTLGNGPISGVKMAPTNNPQIGIIKSDSLGFSVDCAEVGIAPSNDFTSDFITYTLTATLVEATVSELHPEITDSDLELFVGCVAFIGSVDEEKAPAFTVFPNPNNGTFQIQSKPQENLTLQKLTIFNLEGKTVFESENPGLLQSEIKLPSLPNGMYFAQLAFREKNYSVKFLIQH